MAPYGKRVNCFRGSRRRQTEHSTSELQDRIAEHLDQPEHRQENSNFCAFTICKKAYDHKFSLLICKNVPVIPFLRCTMFTDDIGFTDDHIINVHNLIFLDKFQSKRKDSVTTPKTFNNRVDGRNRNCTRKSSSFAGPTGRLSLLCVCAIPQLLENVHAVK